MNQPLLFDDGTVPCPLCHHGRATLGPPRDLGGCVNRRIVGVTCECRGDESVRKDLAHTEATA